MDQASSGLAVRKGWVLSIARRVLPFSLRRWLWKLLSTPKVWPPVGWVNLGGLRRLTPISRYWGFERGLPIDRYYIEQFLAEHSTDIRGHVLEIMDDTYTRQFGADRVSQSDVLSMEPTPQATILGDLTSAEHIPSSSFDCVILTQTLHLIYDVRAALATVQRILKPGGILLLTVPGISQISRYDAERWGDCWRFTTRSARQLLEEFFPKSGVQVCSRGNVLAATALLYGLATRELSQAALDHLDPDYQVIITIKAVKPEAMIVE